MALPKFSPRNYVSRDDALVRTILEKAETLNQTSEIDFDEFIVELTVRDWRLPVGLRQAANSNWNRLRQIERLLDSRFDKVEPGRKFGGTIQTGLVDPYSAKRGELVLADISGGAFTIELPDPSEDDNQIHAVGVKVVVGGGPGDVLTVIPSGGGTIDGDPSFEINCEDVMVTFYMKDGSYKVT